jgi:hypothetical protein
MSGINGTTSILMLVLNWLSAASGVYLLTTCRICWMQMFRRCAPQRKGEPYPGRRFVTSVRQGMLISPSRFTWACGGRRCDWLAAGHTVLARSTFRLLVASRPSPRYRHQLGGDLRLVTSLVGADDALCLALTCRIFRDITYSVFGRRPFHDKVRAPGEPPRQITTCREPTQIALEGPASDLARRVRLRPVRGSSPGRAPS